MAAKTCCHFCLEVVEESSGEKPQLWWGCAGEVVAHALGKHRVTVLVSALGSARRSQSCRLQVGLGSLDSIAGGSQEVCKKLAALPSYFTVLSLRLVCKLLIGCIYLP